MTSAQTIWPLRREFWQHRADQIRLVAGPNSGRRGRGVSFETPQNSSTLFHFTFLSLSFSHFINIDSERRRRRRRPWPRWRWPNSDAANDAPPPLPGQRSKINERP